MNIRETLSNTRTITMMKRKERVHAIRDSSHKPREVTNEEPSKAKTMKCFICSGAHLAKECLVRQRFTAIELLIEGHKLNILIDIGASNIFISEKTATKLGLKLEKSKGRFKTINSNKVPMLRMAQGINMLQCLSFVLFLILYLRFLSVLVLLFVLLSNCFLLLGVTFPGSNEDNPTFFQKRGVFCHS